MEAPARATPPRRPNSPPPGLGAHGLAQAGGFIRHGGAGQGASLVRMTSIVRAGSAAGASWAKADGAAHARATATAMAVFMHSRQPAETTGGGARGCVPGPVRPAEGREDTPSAGKMSSAVQNFRPKDAVRLKAGPEAGPAVGGGLSKTPSLGTGPSSTSCVKSGRVRTDETRTGSGQGSKRVDQGRGGARRHGGEDTVSGPIRPDRARRLDARAPPGPAAAMSSALRPAVAYMAVGLVLVLEDVGQVQGADLQAASSAPLLGQQLQHEGAEAAHGALLHRDQRFVLAGQAQDQVDVQRLGEAGVGDGGRDAAGGEQRRRP